MEKLCQPIRAQTQISVSTNDISRNWSFTHRRTESPLVEMAQPKAVPFENDEIGKPSNRQPQVELDRIGLDYKLGLQAN